MSKAKEKEVPFAKEFRAVVAPEHLLFVLPRGKSGRGFPNKVARAYDPVNKQHYQKVLVGDTYKASIVEDFDYWRYVTVYNVETLAERVAYLPYFEEDCHDASWSMAEWGESRSFKVSLSSSLGAKALGLEASVSMSLETGVTFSAARKVQATKGIAARHYPYKLSDEWKGVTYIQVYWADKKQYGYLTSLRGLDHWLVDYPYAFGLDNQNVGFKVKREIIKKCEGYDPSTDPVDSSQLYIR